MIRAASNESVCVQNRSGGVFDFDSGSFPPDASMTACASSSSLAMASCVREFGGRKSM